MLPALRGHPCNHQTARVDPSTPMEVLVAAVWSSRFARSRIFADDDFFELGGDSLVALRICRELMSLVHSDASQIDGQTGVIRGVLAPHELLKRPRLRDFARLLAHSGCRPLIDAVRTIFFAARTHAKIYQTPMFKKLFYVVGGL